MSILYALVGLVVGAVINLLADDVPQRRWPGWWRCRACSTPRWPLALAALLAGRRNCPCGQPIGWRPLIVELFTAGVFAFLWLYYGPQPQLILASFYLAVYILVAVIDFEHRLILNVVMLPAIVLAIIAGIFNANFNFGSMLKSGLFALVVLLVMYGLGLWVGKMKRINEPVFGQGDVTLGVFIGLTTGPAVVYALAIGIVSAGLAALGYILYHLIAYRRSGLGGFIPYGPFLALGGALMVIWGPAVVAYYK